MTVRGRLAVAVCGALLFGALAGCRYYDAEFAVETTAGIAYGAAYNEDGVLETLRLDLYTPADDTATDRPVVVWVHGGGFSGGNRLEGRVWATELARRGYVAASIDYRIDEDGESMTLPFDAYETQRIAWAASDLKAAVRWFRANSTLYGIDPGRIAVGGVSAGAVTALTAAITPDDPGDNDGNPGESSAVCTAISVSGLADPLLVDAGDAGAVFFHGDEDPLVPYEAAVDVRDAMDGEGLPTSFITYPGEGHGIGNEHRPEILGHIYVWLYVHLVYAPEPCV